MATHEHNAIPPSPLSPDEAPPSPEFLAKHAAFERLYQNWQLARAACCDPDAPDYDVADNARLDAYDAMTTPAFSPSDVFYKWSPDVRRGVFRFGGDEAGIGCWPPLVAFSRARRCNSRARRR